ncbi:MAG: DUF5689 domain-containing protein [Flavobacteriales bacterium]
MKTTNYTILLTILFGVVFAGCKKEFDTPPTREIPVGNVLTIQALKDMYVGQSIKFTDDYSIYANVSMDESTGNLYRNIYVQDATGGINLRLLNSGGVYEGDSIRVYLKGITLSKYNGLFQLDSISVDNNIIKQATLKHITPDVVTINQLDGSHQSKLVKIENVEFVGADLGKTYADAVNQTSQNRTITDCSGNTILVRTSGYANFANELLPTGNGSIIAIVGEFNGTKQLYVRRPAEVIMNEPRCTGGGGCTPENTINETFDDVTDNTDFNKACWSNIATQGTRYWRGRVFSPSEIYVQATAFNSTDATNEIWLISPEVQNSSTKTLSFQTAQSFFTHNGLAVFISTNYNGSNPSAATWTPISATIASSSDPANTFINSGTISLAGYLPMSYTGTFHIGFRYSGNATAGQTGTFRIDNVIIND